MINFFPQLILTYGHSNTVREFLLHGRKKRNFRVVVCESGPSLKGHQMAKELSDGGIETTLITDSAAFAIIHAVNKVSFSYKNCITSIKLSCQSDKVTTSYYENYIKLLVLLSTNHFLTITR